MFDTDGSYLQHQHIRVPPLRADYEPPNIDISVCGDRVRVRVNDGPTFEVRARDLVELAHEVARQALNRPVHLAEQLDDA